jgi:PTS system nitrogen regulatory IIA component
MDVDDRSSELLTLSEVAQYLKVAEKTVLRMVHNNEIPSIKVASQWRFRRSMIDEWLLSQMKSPPKNELVKLIEATREPVPISRLTDKRFILMDLHSGNKEEVLRQLIQPLVEFEFVKDGDDFLDKLLDREQMISTALGRGVAFPHIRRPKESQSSSPVLVIGICKSGTNFDALDGEKSYLFFLLYTDSDVVHLRVQAKLNMLLGEKKLADQLLHADSPDAVMQILVEEDQT